MSEKPEKTALQKRCETIQALADAGFFKSAIAGETPQMLGYKGSWLDVGPDDNLEFSYGPEKYRIKPTPTYRPFTPEEALRHCDREFKSRISVDPIWTIESVSRHAVHWKKTTGLRDRGQMSFDEFLDICRFTDDGTPCGVLCE